jgi:hypothetical protein
VGLRVRVEIVESQKYKSAGESQPVPIMNDGGWPCLGGRVIGSPCLGGRAPTHGCRAYADRGDVLAGPCRPSRPSCQSCTPHPTTSAGCRRPCGGARPGVLLGGRVDWDLPTQRLFLPRNIEAQRRPGTPAWKSWTCAETCGWPTRPPATRCGAPRLRSKTLRRQLLLELPELTEKFPTLAIDRRSAPLPRGDDGMA